MPNYSYVAQRYSQGDSNVTLLSFTADASDILRWGGVPSKNERFHGGFQRALSARYKKIISFFNTGQISPGAIVIAFRPNAAQITELGYPSAWPNQEQHTTKAAFVHLCFSAEDYESLEIPELTAKVRKLLEKRPGFLSAAAEEPSAEEDDQSGPLEVQAAPDEAGEEDSDQDDDLDVGHSKLRAFYDFIGDPGAVNKWIEAEVARIAAIKAQKSLTQAEKEYVAYSPTEKLRSTLVSLLRPAMIVDGQHRVNGAAESDKERVLFTVCAIKESDWVDQVFQFVVLNKMAKPISKDFLTELLNTSLTNEEVKEIDKRLETIGIRNADRRIHRYVNHDSRSPFAGMVAEAGEVAGTDNTGKLSQQGMLALAKRWRAIATSGKTAEMSCFLKYLDVKTLSEARAAWQHYETWLALFFAFWSELKAMYESQQVWIKQEKYHLLYIVTLQALQDVFIESKAKGKIKFQSMNDFREQVREFFADVPGGFFLGWTQTGLQSGKGWEEIKRAVEMFQSGMKLNKVQSKSELFT
jgi:hypothetical protein